MGKITDEISELCYPAITPQAAAILGLTNQANNIYNLLIHIMFLNIMFTGQERNTYSNRYFNRQPNRNKEKRKTNKPC